MEHTTLLFFSISSGEVLVIIIVLFLVMGPKKLPKIARDVGRAVRYMRNATNSITEEITKETTKYKEDLDEHISPVKKEYTKIKKDILRETKKLQNEFNSKDKRNEEEKLGPDKD